MPRSSNCCWFRLGRDAGRRTARCVRGIELGRMLRAERITHLFLTPAALASVPHADPAVTDGLPDLGTIIVGGEACPPDLVARWASGRRMFNAYGPTESTVMVTLAGPFEPGGEVPIGTPITGTTVVVLDRRLPGAGGGHR